MRLLLEGRFSELSRIGEPYRSGVEFDCLVYSKRQARREFARFLSATGLPEMTEREAREERLEKLRNADDILPCGADDGKAG